MNADLWGAYDLVRPYIKEKWQKVTGLIIGLGLFYEAVLWLCRGIKKSVGLFLHWKVIEAHAQNSLFFPLLVTGFVCAILAINFLSQSIDTRRRKLNPHILSKETYKYASVDWIVYGVCNCTKETHDFKVSGVICPKCKTPLHTDKSKMNLECPNESCKSAFNLNHNIRETMDRVKSDLIGQVTRGERTL